METHPRPATPGSGLHDLVFEDDGGIGHGSDVGCGLSPRSMLATICCFTFSQNSIRFAAGLAWRRTIRDPVNRSLFQIEEL